MCTAPEWRGGYPRRSLSLPFPDPPSRFHAPASTDDTRAHDGRSLGSLLLHARTRVRSRSGANARASSADGRRAGRRLDTGSSSAGPASPLRPYNRVITPDAKTTRGLFITHMIGDRLYYEIPRRELNKDELLLARRTGLGGFGTLIVRWERSNNRILLRQYSYASTADTSLPIYRAVEPLEQGGIIASFAIESFGPDSAAVIEVSRLFTTNIPELSGPTGMMPDRSFIESVGAYPTNIEVEATQTGIAPPAGGPLFPGAPAPRAVSQTQRMHYSMLRLPEHPMMPRLEDDRVGYISTSMVDYGRPEHQSVTRRYIHRFRLEKKDPNAAVSEPVKQIVFWIDPATPKWMVPWVKKAVEDWQPAYEAAGFRNAIIAKEAPSKTEDPYWSPDDASHSIIHWRASPIENANGNQVVDPRTGEILKAEVQIYHNIMNLQRDWYFVQVAPLDPRAQKLPLPDSLMGRLVEYVIAHEVGHSIGFPHNFKASAMYPADSIRSPTFLRRMGGHVATLMDYSRFNYVAQPEDKIPVDLLIPTVGPYDIFAVKWGHTPIPGANTPDEEKPTLDKWASVQDTVPWFRFDTPDARGDPESLTESVGDADAVKSSTLGLKNLRRVMTMLRPVAEKPGEDYSLLNELYDQVVIQWSRY
ncbi:MAG: zinc-dependent metalloprotease, partial [Gemmatimonadota bacterium]|nr:zinc-dependent metalloprotease [Gemmatimonadota bacterium]